MQPAQLADGFDSGTQIQVIGIAEKNLNAEFFESVLLHSLDRSQRPHRHKDRCFDFTVWRDQASGAGPVAGRLNLKLERHSLGLEQWKREQPSAFSNPRLLAS